MDLFSIKKSSHIHVVGFGHDSYDSKEFYLRKWKGGMGIAKVRAMDLSTVENPI